MSLYSELSVLPQEAVFYYKKSSDLPNPIAAPELAWEFIDKYFEKGQKAYVFDFDLRRRFERSDRNVHTAVMFYIGCLWQTQMNQLIKANDPNLLDEYEKDFLHLWFLLCLYHDTSYIHEGDFAAVAEIQRNVDML